MAILDDYQEAAERAQTHGFTRGQTAEVPTHGLLYVWEGRLRQTCDRAAHLANSLRAHRLAITGPDERISTAAVSQELDRPAHPSKVQGIEDALGELQKELECAIQEYEELAGIGLVREGDYYF